jgi:hypothetical protein
MQEAKDFQEKVDEVCHKKEDCKHLLYNNISLLLDSLEEPQQISVN